ncbi:hypothetical protein IWW38_004645, partial [Coemansia aciculifera]
LSRAIRTNAAFPGFSEPAVAFAPTYKLTAKGSYDPRRRPAWCDRILTYSRDAVVAPRYIAAWQACQPAPLPAPLLPANPPAIACLRYWSLPIAGSDHLPVFAHFRLDLSRLQLDHDSHHAAAIPSIYDPLRPCYQVLGLVADRSAGAVHLALTDPYALLALCLAMLVALARFYYSCIY